MREKQCDHDDEDKYYRKRIVYVLLGLIAAVAFAVFLVWVILHPHEPRFVLEDVTVSDFSVSEPSFLTTNLQVTLSSHNPNGKIGIFYDHIDVYASYRNQQVTPAILLPATYEGHLDGTVWSPVLYGSTVPMNPYLSKSLNEDLIAGKVLLKIKIDGCVRWKVGSWVSGCYRLHVNCPAFITISGKFSGAGPPIKYQVVERCNVDV
ncbi:unnamed protein product [Cochlearia groenlandica]